MKIITKIRLYKRLRNLPRFIGIKNYFKLVNLYTEVKKANQNKSYILYEQIHQIYLNFIDQKFKFSRIETYEDCKAVHKDLNDQNIWVCWLQGYESMPKIVKLCYSNILKNSNGHKVIFLTLENIHEYLSIPAYIKQNINKGLSFTLFSDYLRLNLLSLYGGLWIDATFLITSPIDKNIFQTTFFSIKNSNSFNDLVCKYKWAVNFMYAAKNCEYIQHIRNIFCQFWKIYNKPITYLFMDYCFEYERINNIKFDKLLNDMPYTNEFSHEIRKNFNNEFNQELLYKWLSNTSFFKLTYKGKFKLLTKDGKPTFYGYLINNY